MFMLKKRVEFGCKFGSSLLIYVTQPKSTASGKAPATVSNKVGARSSIALLLEAFAFAMWIYVHLKIRLLHIAYSHFLSFPRLDSKSDILITEFHSEFMYGLYSRVQLFAWEKCVVNSPSM